RAGACGCPPRPRGVDMGPRGGRPPRALPGAPVRRRSRFADVISTQLDLFEREEAALITQCVEAERAYDRADRDEAEEHYGDYVDLVESATEALADLRRAYAATLDE